MTVFDRGKSDPELFKDLDQRVGDRNTSGYASLATGAWDLVVDTSCYIPGHATAAIEAIDGRAGHHEGRAGDLHSLSATRQRGATHVGGR